jgi:hypothetical protein
VNPTEFLVALWGERPPGVICLWRLRDKSSHWLRNPAGASVIAAGEADMYTGVCLAGQFQDHASRMRLNGAVALAGLWLDIDVDGGPDGKTGGVPHKHNALGLVGKLLEPTLIVDSGYGIHAWYLFDEPWRFATVEERERAALASVQFYELHRRILRGYGWGLDHTHDLTRLLRLPGTVNAKGGLSRPVAMVLGDGPRVARERILDLCDTAGRFTTGYAAVPLPGLGVHASAASAADHELLEAIREADASLAATLDHVGHPGWSQSEWDLSLASLLWAAGWSEQRVADAIVAHRRAWKGAGDPKALRVGYLERTIARAKTVSNEAAAVRNIAETTLDVCADARAQRIAERELQRSVCAPPVTSKE